MTEEFFEECREFLFDILYSDNIPVGYKQQAHNLLDKYKIEANEVRAINDNLPRSFIRMITSAKNIKVEERIYKEVSNLLNKGLKIEAIKILRASTTESGEPILDPQKIDTGLSERLHLSLKDSKDIVDNWHDWKTYETGE